MLTLPENKQIILFDGVCNLCNNSVEFIIKNDANDVFRFVSLQSELGKKIITHIGLDTSKTDSLILYIPKVAYYYKAQAVKNILKELSTWKQLLYFFIPTGYFGNSIYDFIARNRYNWFEKKENCMLPTEKIKQKFLE